MTEAERSLPSVGRRSLTLPLKPSVGRVLLSAVHVFRAVAPL